MQHDEKLLPRMLAILKSEPVDLVVGSRHVAGGGIGGWDAGRAKISAAAARLSRIICKAEIADPMSGFFMLRREVLDGALRRLSGQGFKILLDILASSPRPLRLRELPYEFRERQHGESKLDTRIAWEYMMLIADKLIGHIVPVRFALFALVGGIGLFIHMAVLWFALTIAGAVFDLAQASAAVAAMTSNFFLNNLFTYRDRRLHGVALLRGLFHLLCRSAPSARSPMSASPATSFPGTRSGGSPALPASSSDRSGTTPSRRFSPGSKNNLTRNNPVRDDREY